MYTATINQNGMILLNKTARKALGVELGDRVTVTFTRKSARVERELTDKEFFKKLDSIKTAPVKRRIKKLAGKSADELFSVAIAKSAKEEMIEGA